MSEDTVEKRKMVKTAFITGGSNGIGKGIAFVLASQGYDLVITYHTAKAEAEAVACRIEADYSRKCAVIQADLAIEEVANNIFEKVIEVYGHIDVLVNNAGLTKMSKLAEMEISDLDHLINLNFRAPILIMRSALRHMIAHKIAGNIVNIASTRGIRAYPFDAVYGGTKAALIRATQSIALEGASAGIRVNCIAPGATRVREKNEAFYQMLGEKIPIGRMGTPNDIGKAVAWLISEHASYITGETIRIDGGLILPGMPEDIRPEAGYGWGKV